MAQCLIGLGSNVGDCQQTLRAAWQAIDQFPQTCCLRISSFFTTEPAGGPASQPAFGNAAGVIETSLPFQTLLERLLELELTLGRIRQQRWGPRVIDLDLLIYGNLELRTPALTLPHPRMAFRRFVLQPAAEVAPDFVYPTNGWTIRQLLTHLDEASNVIALAAVDDAVLRQSIRQIVIRSQSAPDCCWSILNHWPRETQIEFNASQQGSPSPKLVVLVDSPADRSESATDRRAIWQALMHQPTVGPVLWLTEPDPVSVADEVVAAMTAMR